MADWKDIVDGVRNGGQKLRDIKRDQEDATDILWNVRELTEASIDATVAEHTYKPRRELAKVLGDVGVAIDIADTVRAGPTIARRIFGGEQTEQAPRDSRTPGIVSQEQQEPVAIEEGERLSIPQGGTAVARADAIFLEEMENAPNLSNDRQKKRAQNEADENLIPLLSENETSENRRLLVDGMTDDQLNQFNAANAAYSRTGDEGYKEGLLGFVQMLINSVFGGPAPEIGQEEAPTHGSGHRPTQSSNPAELFKNAAIEEAVNREDGIDGIETEKDDFYAYVAQSGSTIEQAKQAVAAYASDIELALDQSSDAYKSDIRAERQEQGLER